MIEDINKFETRNEEDNCFDSTITPIAEDAEVDDDGSDLDQPLVELFGVHDVPEAFN
ncbi:hypothetical protein E5676_scaffold96G00370 [Cucumis melo var. makuwa]|uniref:Uncharacterized protein n=1 Tax=Cucumis melo var. makuwa TaxID=1194695 RepID=A0A5D3D2L7_CUCMM|nr:hypothetical protein E6C27_scaffold134G00410 [Cucumis melo var. makuwa]TYK16779.1 hypothetical protein E5676_scaffold96G00370 [Cucumis melo var. makuwa]